MADLVHSAEYKKLHHIFFIQKLFQNSETAFVVYLIDSTLIHTKVTNKKHTEDITLEVD
jgi:hypothetical protein